MINSDVTSTKTTLLILAGIWGVVFILAAIPLCLDIKTRKPQNFIYRRGKRRKRVNARILCFKHLNARRSGEIVIMTDPGNCDICNGRQK